MVNAWFGSGYAGDPPLESLGGLTQIPAGTNDAGTTTVDFEPGVYVFFGRGNQAPMTIREVAGGDFPAAPSPTDSGEAACANSTLDASLVAQSFVFDEACIAVPADTPFTINLDNRDRDAPHNVSIWAQGEKEALFAGATISGPGQITYDVHALRKGTYEFRCDVHPGTMTGTLAVR